MIKKGFATLTVTLILSAIALIAVFYLSKGMLFNAKKANDEAVYYEAYNAAHSGMTQALKTITENNKRLPCLFESKETKNKGTVNNNCYCRPDDNTVTENSEVVCEGQFSFVGEQKENSVLISTYRATIRNDKLGLFEIVSSGQANGFEAILRTVYQSIGGMKTIPKSAIVSTGDVYIVGNTYFHIADGSVTGGSVETGGRLFYDLHQGSKTPNYDFKMIGDDTGISVDPSHGQRPVDETKGFNQNKDINDKNRASSVYLGEEFKKSKTKFLNMADVKVDSGSKCEAVIKSMPDAKSKGKLANHIWLDLDASSIHEFQIYPYIGAGYPSVWGCNLGGKLPSPSEKEPANIVINLTGLPKEDSKAYEYITDPEKGLILYTEGGSNYRGMISLIDSVKDSKVNLRFYAGDTVTMVGTILLDSQGKAWFESSFKLTYDSKLLNDMRDNLKSQGIMAGSWSDY